MKRYLGSDGHDVVVFDGDDVATGRPLDPRTDVANHSPTGFSWGYGGSGPSQLALALAIDVTGDVDRARRVYHALKWLRVEKLPFDGAWTLTEDELLADIEAIEAQQRAPAGAGKPF